MSNKNGYPMKKKNEWIQAFRFILIFLIALSHYTFRFPQLYGDANFAWRFEPGGHIGNCMFMFISGYFLTGSLFVGFGKKDWLKYCVNKWWRLFPSAIICMTIVFIVTHSMPFIEGRTTTITQLFLNFLIIHPGVPYVDGPHWFMAALLQIQLMLSVLFFIKNIKYRKNSLIAFFCISLAIKLVSDKTATAIDDRILYLTSGTWLPMLLAGCITSLVLKGEMHKSYSIVPIIATIIYVSPSWLAYLVPLMLLFVVFAKQMIKVKCPKFFVKLGNISFAWYLVHSNIGFCIMIWLMQHGICDELVCVSVAIVSTLLLAFVVDCGLQRIPTKLMK